MKRLTTYASSIVVDYPYLFIGSQNYDLEFFSFTQLKKIKLNSLMLEKFIKDFFIGGFIYAIITLIIFNLNSKNIYLTGFLYTSPILFPLFLLSINSKYNSKITTIFIEHCIYGSVLSFILLLLNYYKLIKIFSKEKLLIVNLLLIFFFFSCYGLYFSR